MAKTTQHILMFLLLIELVKSDKISIDIYENTQQESVTSCIMNILHKTYTKSLESGRVATLFDIETEKQSATILLRKIYQEYKWAVLKLTSETDLEGLNSPREINSYIIQIRGIEEVKRDLLHLRNQYWYPKAKIILYAEQNFHTDKHINVHIFKTLWAQKALNSIVILPQEEDNTIFDIYTWFPYNNSCGTYEEAFLLNVCQNGNFKTINEFFPKKIPMNLNGCPVKVRTVIWPPYVIAPRNFNPNKTVGINFTKGLEIEMLNTVAKAANITLIYSVSNITEDWGFVFDNGTATGAFGSLTNETDLAIGSLAVTVNRVTYFDASPSYGTESLTWCVPSAGLKPKWMNIFNVYEITTYIFIFSAFLIVFLTTYLLCKITNDIPAYKNVGSNFMNLYAAFLGLSLQLKPKHSSSRIVFFMCAFLNLIIGAVYQTTLITFIANPMYEKQIKTVEQIFENRLGIFYMPQSIMYYTWDTVDWRMQKVLKEMVPCPDAYNCINAIALQRNASIASPRLFLLYSLDKLTTADGQILVYWFKKDIISYPIQIFMTKGFPLAGIIGTYIVQILQTGIMDKLQQDLQQKLNMKNKLINNSNDDNFQLSLDQLYGAFLVLFVGIVLSSFAFVAERIVYKHTNKKIEFKH